MSMIQLIMMCLNISLVKSHTKNKRVKKKQRKKQTWPYQQKTRPAIDLETNNNISLRNQ